ncbi:hypothetical protein N9H93_04295 [Rhizobiaceae bacterium]|nr:hypothetical protein [Rhizobiaceae bacterium]
MTTFTVTSAVLLLAGLWIIATVALILRHAAARSGDAQAHRAARTTAAVLTAWALAATTFSAFVPLSFPVFLPMALVPILLGTWAMFQPGFTTMLSHVRIDLLVAVQVYRIAGAIFLYLYWTTGTLSWGFARNAGWGDVATGVLALPVAVMVWKRTPYAAQALVGWCLLGIGDLIVAPLSAGYYGAERLVEFPINTVPMFLGPPLGILLQIVVLRAWWLQRESFAAIATDTPSAPHSST